MGAGFKRISTGIVLLCLFASVKAVYFTSIEECKTHCNGGRCYDHGEVISLSRRYQCHGMKETEDNAYNGTNDKEEQKTTVSTPSLTPTTMRETSLPVEQPNTNGYYKVDENDFIQVPVSTIWIAVITFFVIIIVVLVLLIAILYVLWRLKMSIPIQMEQLFRRRNGDIVEKNGAIKRSASGQSMDVIVAHPEGGLSEHDVTNATRV
ncbi:uncharacterized protein [Ptychodera flava]|uniref:uncharacterized protein n=1 Tax=Ptychodera flava TaxID=63121 RepID=UPI00396A2298